MWNVSFGLISPHFPYFLEIMDAVSVGMKKKRNIQIVISTLTVRSHPWKASLEDIPVYQAGRCQATFYCLTTVWLRRKREVLPSSAVQTCSPLEMCSASWSIKYSKTGNWLWSAEVIIQNGMGQKSTSSKLLQFVPFYSPKCCYKTMWCHSLVNMLLLQTIWTIL